MANKAWEAANNPFADEKAPPIPTRRKAAPPIPSRAKTKSPPSASSSTAAPAKKPFKKPLRTEGLTQSAQLCYEHNLFGKTDLGIALPGEKDVLKGIESIYQDKRGRKMRGTVSMSNYQFVFTPEKKTHIPPAYFHIPLGCISRIEKDDPRQPSKAQRARAAMKSAMKSAASVVMNTGKDKVPQMVLKLHCKDIRYLRFIFTGKNAFARGTNIYRAVDAFAFPAKETELSFATMSKEATLTAAALTAPDSPHYDFHTEFGRLGVLNNKLWRVSEINVTYEYAPTYPRFIVVPKDISDDDLRSIGTFRSKARVPSMSWSMGDKGPTLWRCSQPKVGLGDHRCPEDEKLLKCIQHSNPGQLRFLIGDARPRVNAMANRVKGWGYETQEGYSFSDLKFYDIENIHAMRGSLHKLEDLLIGAKTKEGRWLADVESTGWLYHGRCVLKGAITTAETMFLQNRSVLVHCSDGWDRTAQLSGLVQVMLDPFARTKRGYCILIQKEWCSFGHQFQKRIGHANAKHDDQQRSPVFLQFLDCTYQLLAQYPQCFEFTSAFLVEIADHLYSCRFGSFFGNNERERAKVRKNTPSLWDHVMKKEFCPKFNNPVYLGEQGALLPSGSMCCRNMRVWKEYFLRWSTIPSMPSAIFFDSTSAHPPPHVWPSSQEMAVNIHLLKQKERAEAAERQLAEKEAEIEALKAALAAAKAPTVTPPSPQRDPNARSSKLMMALCANDEGSDDDQTPEEKSQPESAEPSAALAETDTSAMFDVSGDEDDEISSLRGSVTTEATDKDPLLAATTDKDPLLASTTEKDPLLASTTEKDPLLDVTTAEDPLLDSDSEVSDELL